MADAVKLVTGSDQAAETIQRKLAGLVEVAAEGDCVGLAAVIVRRDGRCSVATCGNGNRLLLLGAVADLQYTLAADGDK